MSQHHRQWANSGSRKHRARLAATLPTPCCRCGRMVTKDLPWEADHVVPLASWPQGQPYPDALIRVACKSCNRRAGGKDGARITNTRKRAARNESKDIREW